jgi:uncharacterized membrane protein
MTNEDGAIGTGARPAELPQGPVTMAGEQTGFNAVLAAAITRRVGSMPALYVVLVIVGGWMALATWGPLHRLDPYPFKFLLFLDNVVQLLLCSVILVGQRVLGVAADRRAVQTYQSAEAIFEQVADLQEHLDRHDRALSRGISLLDSSPHPWIQRHQVEPPPQAIDQAVSVNDRIAAWLTERLGSMQAFYASAFIQVAWIGLADIGVQRFDPYPFVFMTFLSTLAQLIFMMVIMVGQDVIGRAADRRSEQTFLDAGAILHECRRMKARLTAQDRVIDSLSGYTTTQVTEQLAQAIHRTYLQAAAGRGEALSSRPSLREWEELPDEVKESNRAQARQVGEKLAVIGCFMVPAFDRALTFEFEDEEVQLLAQLEHERWMGERMARGYASGPARQGRTHPDLVLWEELPDEEREKNVAAVQSIPALLDNVGFQALRRGVQDGSGQADFTAAEWAILQQAMMAAGLLVSLAEDTGDADEMFALIKKLRDSSITHPQRFIRELAAASTFSTGWRVGTRYADYEPSALAAIRSAADIVAQKAAPELPGFRAFLAEIAAVVADANIEGGFFKVGGRRRTPSEAAAMAAVSRAAGLQPLG